MVQTSRYLTNGLDKLVFCTANRRKLPIPIQKIAVFSCVCYKLRNAAIGSTDAARAAGIADATSAITIMINTPDK